jgi:hypothetical protein
MQLSAIDGAKDVRMWIPQRIRQLGGQSRQIVRQVDDFFEAIYVYALLTGSKNGGLRYALPACGSQS